MQRQDRTVSQPAIARDLIELQCDSTASSKLLCPSLSQSVCLIGFNCCVQHWWRLLLASPLPAAALLPPALLLLAFMATWHAREQVVMISNVRQSGSPSPPSSLLLLFNSRHFCVHLNWLFDFGIRRLCSAMAMIEQQSDGSKIDSN